MHGRILTRLTPSTISLPTTNLTRPIPTERMTIESKGKLSCHPREQLAKRWRGANKTEISRFRCRTKSQRSNRYELRFKTTNSENGLILWLSRGHSLQADYLALALVHSHLELSFNLGKQTAFLTSRSAVSRPPTSLILNLAIIRWP